MIHYELSRGDIRLLLDVLLAAEISDADADIIEEITNILDQAQGAASKHEVTITIPEMSDSDLRLFSTK